MGDVLFTWNPIADTSITLDNMRDIMNSETWHDFERGHLSATECYSLRGTALSLSPSEIAATFQQTTASLSPDKNMTALVHELKSHGAAVYMMTNTPRGDFDVLRRVEYVWEAFDGVFASGYVGFRKPDAGFYEMVLREVGVEAGQVLFVDDKLENVVGARESGMVGVHFGDVQSGCAEIRALVGLAETEGGWV
ncbi:HAD-like domain-containing protein [Aspergillus carlsbadensis]|nr:HAD-like domain-containing protein [Aspergillus carlsbadensis]